MRLRTCLLSAFTLATAMFSSTGVILPLSVNAETPKEGTDDFTNTWLFTGYSPLKIGDRTVEAYELNGVHRNDNNGANMGMRCLGIYEIGGTGPYHEHGACIFADKDGDQIMMAYESNSASSGTETLVAGTGKFAGISGTGEYKVLQIRLHADDKVNRGIVAERTHWKLP